MPSNKDKKTEEQLEEKDISLLFELLGQDANDVDPKERIGKLLQQGRIRESGGTAFPEDADYEDLITYMIQKDELIKSADEAFGGLSKNTPYSLEVPDPERQGKTVKKQVDYIRPEQLALMQKALRELYYPYQNTDEYDKLKRYIDILVSREKRLKEQANLSDTRSRSKDDVNLYRKEGYIQLKDDELQVLTELGEKLTNDARERMLLVDDLHGSFRGVSFSFSDKKPALESAKMGGFAVDSNSLKVRDILKKEVNGILQELLATYSLTSWDSPEYKALENSVKYVSGRLTKDSSTYSPEALADLFSKRDEKGKNLLETIEDYIESKSSSTKIFSKGTSKKDLSSRQIRRLSICHRLKEIHRTITDQTISKDPKACERRLLENRVAHKAILGLSTKVAAGVLRSTSEAGNDYKVVFDRFASLGGVGNKSDELLNKLLKQPPKKILETIYPSELAGRLGKTTAEMRREANDNLHELMKAPSPNLPALYMFTIKRLGNMISEFSNLSNFHNSDEYDELRTGMEQARDMLIRDAQHAEELSLVSFRRDIEAVTDKARHYLIRHQNDIPVLTDSKTVKKLGLAAEITLIDKFVNERDSVSVSGLLKKLYAHQMQQRDLIDRKHELPDGKRGLLKKQAEMKQGRNFKEEYMEEYGDEEGKEKYQELLKKINTLDNYKFAFNSMNLGCGGTGREYDYSGNLDLYQKEAKFTGEMKKIGDKDLRTLLEAVTKHEPLSDVLEKQAQAIEDSRNVEAPENEKGAVLV